MSCLHSTLELEGNSALKETHFYQQGPGLKGLMTPETTLPAERVFKYTVEHSVFKP